MIKKSAIFWLVLSVLTGIPRAGASETLEAPPIIFGEGEQRLIEVPGLERFSLGSDCIRSVPGPKSRGDSLLIKAVKKGSTDLWVWKKDGSAERRSIRVLNWEDEGRPKQIALEKALSRLEEVEVILSGQEGGAAYLLRGEVGTLREASRIRALEKGFPKFILNETTPSPALLEQGEKSLRTWLSKSKHKDDLWIERIDENASLWLRGSIDSPAEREETEARALAIFPPLKTELSALPDASPTIHFRVFLLEMKKNKLRSLGLEWNGNVPGAVKIGPWGLSQAIQLEAALKAMEGEGSVKILSRPELVVRAPGEAELFAGGELPIETRTPYQSQVSWRQFGLLLKLKVITATRRKVRVDVMTEVSHLDPSIALRDIPGLQANRMKTQVDATFGSPLLLSGLLQEGIHKVARGLPLLSRIPILGSLFGSKDFQSERSELVAILLPANEPPPAPMEKVARFHSHQPVGPIPVATNWISPEEEARLRASPDYPWNAFHDEKPRVIPAMEPSPTTENPEPMTL